MNGLQIALTLFGGLALFIYGMNLMSDGLQKAAGEKMKSILALLTKNPLIGVLAGALVTAVIQSSSATTVMVIGFVSAGLMNLPQAISIILGANIGTTITAQLVAFKIGDYAWAFVIIGFIMFFFLAKKEKIMDVGQVLFGFGVLFVGLNIMGDAMKPLSATPEFADLMLNVADTPVLGVIVGALLTAVIQSSSASIAVLQNLASTAGPDGVTSIIGLAGAIPILFGTNIGTTITANIAASVGNTQAKRAALSHTIFNLFGVLWALILYRPFLQLVGIITETLFGLPNPAAEGFVITDSNAAEGTAALYGLSMLHTLFNVTNTLLLVWFTKPIARAVSWIIPTPKNQEKEVSRLQYISAGPLATPELSIEQAFNEIIHFAQISKNGAVYTKTAINEADTDKFEEMRKKLVKYEEISDRIEYEIATFLNSVSSEEISENTSIKVKAMYKIIGELESLGDSCEAISRILSRKNMRNKRFNQEAIKNLNIMADAVCVAYDVMIENLTAAHKGELVDIANAYSAEDHLNSLRNNIRDAVIEDIDNNGNNYHANVYYMDLVNEYEHMGDFMINVSQDLERAFVSK